MKQAVQKISDRQKTAARIATGRKKLAIALFLFAIMVVFWAKVFMGKGGPKTASAIADINAAGIAGKSTGLQVIYTELPVDACRHNVLANDFFAANDFKEFRRQDGSAVGSETSVSDAENPQLGLTAAAKELELIAIVNDKKPQAFIGDRLLEEGQSLRYVFRGQVYDFKVVKILENKVELDCNGVIITKKIPEIFKAE